MSIQHITSLNEHRKIFVKVSAERLYVVSTTEHGIFGRIWVQKYLKFTRTKTANEVTTYRAETLLAEV